jgi:hypothetical protein
VGEHAAKRLSMWGDLAVARHWRTISSPFLLHLNLEVK